MMRTIRPKAAEVLVEYSWMRTTDGVRHPIERNRCFVAFPTKRDAARFERRLLKLMRDASKWEEQ